MNTDCTAITNNEEKKRVEAKILNEWDNGLLYDFKKNYPNAKIILSLPNKAASNSNKGIDYWCSIFNENDNLIGRFSIIGDQLIKSILMVKEK